MKAKERNEIAAKELVWNVINISGKTIFSTQDIFKLVDNRIGQISTRNALLSLANEGKLTIRRYKHNIWEYTL